MLPNEPIAQRLDEVARLLNEQGASLYRVEAWRRAAMNVRRLPAPVSRIYEREGTDGLRKLPGVGDRIGIALRDLIVTGKLPMLDRLRGEMDPVEILRSVPGIGRVQAARLHHDLGIDHLEDLEAAAHDGRLATVAGFGEKRIAGIVDSLASRLGRVRQPASIPPDEVSVEELLDIDREYREAAEAGNCAGSLPGDSIRKARPGSRSSTLSAAIASTQRCSRTLLARTTWEGRAIGSSSIGTASLANASARS